MHRKKPFSHKQKKKQIQAKRERQREAADDEDKRERGEFVPEKRREKKANPNPNDNSGGRGRSVWISNVTDDGYSLRTVFEKEPQSVIEARKKDAMKPITRKIQKEKRAYYGQMIDIPTRPEWVYGMSKEELEKREKESFEAYLKGIYDTYPRENLNMFEHNLEVWRQLWRVCETSDLLCVLTDIRHPIFHFPPSLYRYVVHYHKKPLILVLTKADLVPEELVKKWVDYFKTNFPHIRVAAVNSITKFKEDLTKGGTKRKTRVVFKKSDRYNGRWIDLLQIINSIVVEFGAQPIPIPEKQLAKVAEEQNMEVEAEKEEVEKDKKSTRKTKESTEDEEESDEEGEKPKRGGQQQRRAKESTDEDEEESEDDFEEAPDSVVAKDDAEEEEYMQSLASGLKRKREYVTIGFIGSPNVGKSTLINALMGRKYCSESRTPGHTKHRQTLYLNPTLVVADCPGLVFPAANVPRELQVLCGIFPISQCREPYSAIKFLGERVKLEEVYKLTKETDDPWSAYDICDAYAEKRGYHTKAGRTNTYRAGLEILYNVVDGKLQWYFDPDSIKIDIHVYLHGKQSEKHLEDEIEVVELAETEPQLKQSEKHDKIEVVEFAEPKSTTTRRPQPQQRKEQENEEEEESEEDESGSDNGGGYNNPFAVLGV